MIVSKNKVIYLILNRISLGESIQRLRLAGKFVFLIMGKPVAL